MKTKKLPSFKFEIFKDEKREWRWHLRSRNGNIVATCGEGYKRKRSVHRIIERIEHFMWETHTGKIIDGDNCKPGIDL